MNGIRSLFRQNMVLQRNGSWLGIILFATFLCQSPRALVAQSLTAASPSEFSSLNVCGPGPHTPAEYCSATQASYFQVTESGNLGTPKVVTGGTPTLDFTLASGSTCVGEVTAGTYCVVNVTFTPQMTGYRTGGVLITDTSGRVLTTGLAYGIGYQGPRAEFDPGTTISLACCGSGPTQAAVDTSGDLYIAGTEENPTTHQTVGIVQELPVGGGAPINRPLLAGQLPAQIAVDGAGNVFVVDTANAQILKLPAGGGPPLTVFSSSSIGDYAGALAVDGAGDLFVGLSNNTDVLRLPPGCQSTNCGTLVTGSGKFVNILPPPMGTTTWSVDASGVFFFITIPPKSDGENAVYASSGGEVESLGGATEISGTSGLATDAIDNLYVVTNASGFKGVHEWIAGVPLDIGIYQPDIYDVAIFLTNPATVSSSIVVSPLGDIFTGASASVSEVQHSQPAPLKFGTIAFGSTKTMPLTITNSGTSTLSVTPSIAGPSYKIISSDPDNCMAGILAAQTCTLSVEFTPRTVGTHNDALTLQTNGPTNPIGQLQGIATGVGTEDEFPLAFPTISFGATSVLPLTIYNVGIPGTVTIKTSISGPSFKILTTAANTCLTGVAEGKSCVLPVEFSPAAVGYHGDDLTLTPSVGSASKIALTGTATAPAAP